jgi:methyltransferase
MGEGGWLVAFIVIERLAELLLAKRNTARLFDAGGVEFGGSHYLLIVALHVAWIMGLWFFARDQHIDRTLLGIFVLLQGARFWVIRSLGSRWTTRVIVVPGMPPVSRGPYRLMRHPNYCIVALEIAIVPLALGLPIFAVIFFLLNAALLFWRIRVEDAALALAAASRID